MTPPTLPGEVWRGTVADVCGYNGSLLCAVCNGVDGVSMHYWNDADEWERFGMFESDAREDVLTAWALSLVAERAEVRAILYASTTESTPDAARRVARTIERERKTRRAYGGET